MHDLSPVQDPIPSRWQPFHNGLLALALLSSMLWLLFSLDQSSLAVVEIVGVRLQHVAWVSGISLSLGVYALWLHARHLQSEYGIPFRNDGRDDRVLTGIILGTALIFCGLWSVILDYNESAPLSQPPQRYTLLRREESVIELKSKASRTEMRLRLSGYRTALFRRMQAGDTFWVNWQPGRLGFAYISHLSWQNKKGKVTQLWPRQRSLLSPSEFPPK